MKKLLFFCTLILVCFAQCLCFPLDSYVKTDDAIIEESYKQGYSGTVINNSNGNYITVNNNYYNNLIAEEGKNTNNTESKHIDLSDFISFNISDEFKLILVFDFMSTCKNKKRKKENDEENDDRSSK